MRTRIVWGALLIAMVGVGGLLAVLDGRPLPQVNGRSLPPLVAAVGPSSVESIWSTRAELDRRRWQEIVIHHSGSPVGTPARIEDSHRAARLNGLGFHFIIGNGAGMEDGEIYVGYRWLDQIAGAHVAWPSGDQHNAVSIGICLVGDGTRRPFSETQIRRLVQLVRTLSNELDIPDDRLYLHSDLADVSSPGQFFPHAAFREQVASLR